MKPPDFEYLSPTSVEEAVSALASADGEAKVLAGGQSLVPLLNFRLASPSLLVDINRVTSLSGVVRSEGSLRIGAMTRMSRLETDPSVRSSMPLLSAAASWVGHPQIRNRGTVGGSLAHADPAAEVPAICLLLDAEVTVLSVRGARAVRADDLFAGFLTTTLGEDEVLTSIRIPIPAADERWGFREFAQRRGDFALAGAATSIALDEAGLVTRARIVLFGTSDRPVRPAEAEAALAGRRPTGDVLAEAARLAAEAAALDDPRPDAAYRRTLFETVARRALDDAARQEVA